MKKLFTLFTVLLLCTASSWAQSQTTTLKDEWNYASSVTVVRTPLDATQLQAGDKIVFARKSNSSKYITISNEGVIRKGSDHTTFQDASGLSVFTVGGTSNAWTFQSARPGYYFPRLTATTWIDYFCEKTNSPATFQVNATGDGDNSFFIGNNGGNWFDGNATQFTAWYGSGANAKYYVYRVEESDETTTTSSSLGTLTNNNSQYIYQSPQIAGSRNLQSIRLTFKATNTNNLCNGTSYPFVHLSEFYLYDKDGAQVDLSKYDAELIFSSNATSADEGGIDKLNDGVTSGASDKYNWYWHSAWRNGPSEYHYLEINVAGIDADLSTFQIGYVTRNTQCVPKEIDVTATKMDAASLKETVNANVDYIAARDHQSEDHPVVGLKPYSVTKALTDAMDAVEPDIDEIQSAYVQFTNAEAIELQAGKTYRIISAYPGYETNESGDKKKKAIYSDGAGLVWKAIDAWKSESTPDVYTPDYFKSVWTIANISGNTFTMLNLYDGAYPQSVLSNDTKTPLSRTNVNTCTLASLGQGQYNITSKGSGQAFHTGGHSNGAGTSGNIVRWNGGLNTCSAWYLMEAGIEMPASGHYRIRNAVDDMYMQTTAAGLGAVETSNTDINTIFSLKKNEDGTYYMQGDDGRYVQEASRSSQVTMKTTPVKYFITRSVDGQWDFRAQAAVESDYNFHYLHTNNDTKVVGWQIDGSAKSHWTIAEVTGYTFYPVELTGPSGATEMAVKVLTDGYTGSTILYNGGFYAFNDGSAPTASSFEDYDTDILETSDITVADNKVTASFTAVDITPIFTVSDDGTNAYYYIHNGNSSSWYVRATNGDKIAVTNKDKTTDGAGIFQFYEAGTTNAQGYWQYYIYNTGAQAWVKYNSVSEGTNKVELVSNKSDATKWLIITEAGNTSVDVIPGELRVTTDAQSWNAHGGVSEGKQMGLYARNDGNSTWVLESVELGDEVLATLKNNYVRYYAPKYTDSYEHAGELGYLKQEFLDGLYEIADVTTLKNTWENRATNAYVLPENGHFYKFLCAGNKNQYIVDANYNTSRVSVSATDDNNVWCYYNNMLIGYGTGCKIGCVSKHMKLAEPAADGVSIDFQKSNTEGQLLIHFMSGAENRYAYGNSDNQIDAGSSANEDAGYRWKISEVTSIPVTFKEAGLGYATFNSPVAVQIPENTKAYVCKIGTDGNTLTFYEITSVVDESGEKTIPANTPVLLYNSTVKDAGSDVTVSFPVTTIDTEITNNSFVGTLATEAFSTSDSEKDTYSLRTNTIEGVKKVGFYKKTSGTTLAGFKAWLQTAHQDQARNFTIYFNGEDDATGIAEALGLDSDKVEIYDLSGRKLSGYQKGINIVNGKKIFK